MVEPPDEPAPLRVDQRAADDGERLDAVVGPEGGVLGGDGGVDEVVGEIWSRATKVRQP